MPTRRRRRVGEETLTPMALIVFTPTGAGKDVFRPVQREAADHSTHAYAAMCVGRGHVDTVVRWTEPAELFGQTVSRVTYRYSAADIPAIVPSEIRAEVSRSKETTATLVRTSDGWQPAR